VSTLTSPSTRRVAQRRQPARIDAIGRRLPPAQKPSRRGAQLRPALHGVEALLQQAVRGRVERGPAAQLLMS
jgi:hypothetical protein